MKGHGENLPVIASSVFLVIHKFPQHKGVIQRLYKSNDEFRALCDDYLKCKEALTYWNISNSDQAPLRVNEYQSLLEGLENEILRHLKDC